jgi:hypothetical protein
LIIVTRKLLASFTSAASTLVVVQMKLLLLQCLIADVGRVVAAAVVGH